MGKSRHALASKARKILTTSPVVKGQPIISEKRRVTGARTRFVCVLNEANHNTGTACRKFVAFISVLFLLVTEQKKTRSLPSHDKLRVFVLKVRLTSEPINKLLRP